MKKGKDLKQLLAAAGISWDGPALMVTGLNYDSRLIEKGDLFFAVPGVHVDGHKFLEDVLKKGAVAAVVEKSVPTSLPIVKTSSTLAAMSTISNAFFENPSSRLPVMGVTGTNGKTTITYLVEDILRSLGKTCGVMGTISYRLGPQAVEAPNTTPLAVDVQRFLSDLIDKKVDAAIMEVSSHALVLGRVDHVQYAVGIFTNLTQDHLDFHKTMESYFEAKAMLFRKRPGIKAVINIDDSYGVKLAEELKTTFRFGESETADIRAMNVVCDLTGIKFNLRLPSGKSYAVKTNLMGHHNVSNCLAAAGAVLALGFREDQVVQGLNQSHAVPGRLERVEGKKKSVVVVDYAHTPDALEKVLTALQETGPKRLFCVFGAGGDRDRTKRPKMGRIATQLATHVYVTSDNPRSEDPVAIIKEIEMGIQEAGKNNYTVQIDRAQAIRAALKEAKEGDIVLIAGKGHETYQIIGREKFHFSDQETAREALNS